MEGTGLLEPLCVWFVVFYCYLTYRYVFFTALADQSMGKKGAQGMISIQAARSQEQLVLSIFSSRMKWQ